MAKTISLVILIAMCVILVSSSQYFPFKKYGKPPSKLVCPVPTGFGVCAELCLSDADCQNEQKCCSNGCGHQCTDPVSGGHKPIRKPRNNNWICPPATGPGICVSLCSGDNSCPGGQKCCSNGCGQVCTNPIRGPGGY